MAQLFSQDYLGYMYWDNLLPNVITCAVHQDGTTAIGAQEICNSYQLPLPGAHSLPAYSIVRTVEHYNILLI